MAFFTGKTGTLKMMAANSSPDYVFTSGPATPDATVVEVGQLRDWSITINAGTYDVTSMGNQWGRSITGIKTWTGNATVDLDPSSAQNHDVLLDSILPDEFSPSVAAQSDGRLEGVFYIDDESAAGSKKAFYGELIVTSVDVTTAADGVIQARISFTGYGPLKYSAALNN